MDYDTCQTKKSTLKEFSANLLLINPNFQTLHLKKLTFKSLYINIINLSI